MTTEETESPELTLFQAYRRRLWTGFRIFLIALVILEVLLQIVVRSQSLHHPDPRSFTDVDGKRILCVGDSFTYGVGAPKGMSYPDMLQEKLGDSYTVVNRGWPGANSSMVAAYMPEWMEKYEPDLVLVLSGVNNNYNPLGSSHEALVAAGLHEEPGSLGFLHKVDQVFFNLVTYRLVRWWLHDDDSWEQIEKMALKSDTDAYHLSQSHRNFDDWERQSIPERVGPLFNRFHQAQDSGDHQKAVSLVKEILRSVESYVDFAEFHINLLRYCREHVSEEEYREIASILKKVLPPEAYRICVEDPGFLSREHDLATKMLWYDLSRMRRVIEAKGGVMALLTYPLGAFSFAQERFAKRHNLPFVDSRFDPSDPKFKSYFAKRDSHLNEHGNKVFSQSVLDQLRAKGFFKQP